MTSRRREAATGYGMAIPALIILGAFVWLPAVSLLVLSFTDWNGISPNVALVGIRNYVTAIHDPLFLQSLVNTLVYVGATLPMVLVAGLGAALLVEHGGPLSGLLRVAFTIPFVVSIVVVAVVWSWIFDPHFGVLNFVLERFGVRGQDWLDEPRWAMLIIILPSVWRQFGYYMLILLAGLKNIDRSYREAAEMDGARYWSRLLRVTLPLLGPQLFFSLVICAIDSFQVFAQVDLMTQGGPVGSTTVAIYYMYQQGFQYFQMGIASAVAVMLVVGVGALTYAQVRWVGRPVYYR